MSVNYSQFEMMVNVIYFYNLTDYLKRKIDLIFHIVVSYIYTV